MSAADEDILEGEEEEKEEEELVDPDTLPAGRCTLVVGGWSALRTVTEALGAAQEGDLITCKAATYEEEIVLEKRGVEIRGTADMGVIFAKGVHSIAMDALVASVCVQGGVVVRCGNLALQDCNLQNAHIAVQVFRTASPNITRCTFHDIRKAHVHVHAGGRGTYTGNQMQGGSVGFHLDDCAEVLISENVITATETGVYTAHGCEAAKIEKNKIKDVTGSAIFIDLQSRPRVRWNEVGGAQHYGVLISGGSAGVLSDNLLHSSLRIRQGCMPSLFRNFVVEPSKVLRDEAQYDLRGVEVKKPSEVKRWKIPQPEPPAEVEE